MGKNIYSLVLNDEVIAMIDNVAYKKGVSRSTLVNRVLADYVGYEMEEKRLERMLSLVDEIIMGEQRMRLLAQNREKVFSIISALNYKYSPRITYQVELKNGNDSFGQLIISYRTSKPELIGAIESFFATWITVERQFLPYEVEYTLKDGKLKRELKDVGVADSAEDIAKIITTYVKNMDKLLNIYITEGEDIRDEMLTSRYLQQESNGRI